MGHLCKLCLVAVVLALFFVLADAPLRSQRENEEKIEPWKALSNEKLIYHLNTLRKALRQRQIKEEEARRLTRIGILEEFFATISKKAWRENEILADERAFEALTILSLDALRELDGIFKAIPINARAYKLRNKPKTREELARANFAILTRAWFSKSRLKNLSYPQDYFTKLWEAGIGRQYRKPEKDFPPEFYAMRILHIVIYEDRQKLKKWAKEIIPPFLDLSGYMAAVAPFGAEPGRRLRSIYEELSAQEEVSR